MIYASIPSSLKILIAALALNSSQGLDRSEVLCLSKAVYFESRDQDRPTQESIASFMVDFADRNDVTICDEIYKSKGLRYTWTINENLDLSNPIEEDAWRQAVDISIKTLDGDVYHNTKRANHFLMPYIIEELPDWYDTELVVHEVGVVEFLRLPNYK